MVCTHCGKTLTRMVSLIVTAPASTRTLGKNAVRSKDIQIIAANWPMSTVYCVQCGNIPEIADPISILSNVLVKMDRLISEKPKNITTEDIKELQEHLLETRFNFK